MDLFTYQEDIKKLAQEYHNELQFVMRIRLSEAGYAPDLKSRTEIKVIEAEAGQAFSSGLMWEDPEEYIHLMYHLLVRCWCVRVNGKPAKNLFDQPILPRSQKPRFTTLERAMSKLPEKMKLPDGTNIA